MTVFGFGREGLKKFLDSVPQSVSIGFLETTDPAAIHEHVAKLAVPSPAAVGRASPKP
jgi:hypothetical protein